MAAITLRCGGLTTEEINISAGTAEINQLVIGSGPTITAISSDPNLSASSDSILATNDAIDAYIAKSDAATLVDTKWVTDYQTGNGYYQPIFSDEGTYFIKAHGTDSGTIEFGNGSEGLALTADEPINANSAIYMESLGITSAGFRNATGNYRWMATPIDPQPVAGVAGPQIMQTVDWATYAFAPGVDSRYFASVMIPFSGDHDGQSTELRLYMRYSMSGDSVEPIIFRTNYQLAIAGDTFTQGGQQDTTLTPNGTANVMITTRLIMPDIATPAVVGAQFALSFARIGLNSPNPDYLFVWDISLVYNRAVWGTFASEL